MKKITILLCALFLNLSIFGASTNFMVNLATAKHKAAVEGKLYMVHFTANWCTPCKWMSQHTFSDTRVVDYLTDYYVPVKINVEDFDGIIIKQKHNVQFLPTLLIFNSKGEEVGRFEEAIGPSKLMTILEENNIPVNTEKIKLLEPEKAKNPDAISRPILPSIFEDKNTNINSNTEVNIEQEASVLDEGSKTESPETTDMSKYTLPSTQSNTDYLDPVEKESSHAGQINNLEPNPLSTNSETNNESAAESMAFLTGEGIFELDVKYKQKKGFSVQIGLYAQYANVLAEVHKFKNAFEQRIYVHIGKVNGVPVYRLLLGSFDTKNEADNFESTLKQKGLDCFVNDLSKL